MRADQPAAGDATIATLIERAAAQGLQATFLIDPESGTNLTFAELRTRVAAMAAQLRQRGLMHGERVCVAMDNGPQAVVALLAAMSGGYVAVPLDPGAGPVPIADIVRHCKARILLVADERRAQIEPIAAQLNVPIEGIDNGAPAPAGSTATASDIALPRVHPDDDALLMYTSGSTGRPKGVLLSHTTIVARVDNCARAHELQDGDRLLCVLPLYHMSALIIMLGVLQSRGSMVMPPRFHVARYWDWVVAYGCTWLGVVPTIVAQLLRWGETHAGPPLDALRRVRFARCSSAPLSDDAQRAFEERFGIVLVQGMGMTETGGIFLNPPHRAQRKIGALGRSCGLEVRVVDPDGRELGCGQTGELLVRGPGVMRGYYEDAEATASAFDPAGWLRTGDLAYRDADGYFFHAGRVKDLIIKAGVNVAPREVDEALASHPDVAQAAAVGVSDPDLGEDIGAFVLLRAGARCSERSLLDHCAARLGEFKTPSWITFVDALPSGPTGKMQRAELARRAIGSSRTAGSAPQSAAPSGEIEHDAQNASVERVIAAAWADVLECEHVGRHDNFFALGGTSLLALRLTARLRESLGVQLSLGALLAAQTVAAQAALVAERQHSSPSDAAPVPGVGTADEAATSATLLAPVDQHNAGVPLFCVHDIGRFRRLAQLLGPQQPVYGVSVGPAIAAIASGQPTATFARYSIEELARVCVPEIRRIQPAGPYRIAGFSFGGRIALEVAQQLRAAGADVGLLVILDTFLPGAFRRRPLQRLGMHVTELLRRGPRYIPAAARRRWGHIDPPAPAPDPDDGATEDQRYAAFRQQLRSRYQPQPFPSPVLLFRATVRDDLAREFRIDPRLGWGRIARGALYVHDVPGAHLDILGETATPIVAATLRRHLRVKSSE